MIGAAAGWLATAVVTAIFGLAVGAALVPLYLMIRPVLAAKTEKIS